jgi:hypothetical protein
MYMAKINGKAFYNHRIRENGKKVNIFDKVNEIKQHLKDIIPEIKSDEVTAPCPKGQGFPHDAPSDFLHNFWQSQAE